MADGKSRSLIDQVIDVSLGTSEASADATTLEYLRIALVDWIGVTVAGAQEPSGRLVRSVLRREGGERQATVVGTSDVMTARQAALANGIAGHALDYDDMGLGGAHPSVVIVPAVLAAAERERASGEQVAEALLVGYEALALVSFAAGWTAYRRGFHTTGTVGTIAAAAACARLRGLDRDKCRAAIGLASTQAAGLKASFGTMGKHLNAGQAAANGLLAADLAGAGFTGAADGLQDVQGFLNAHGDPNEVDLNRVRAALGDDPAVRHLLFKVHASCGGTHSTIESVSEAMSLAGVAPSDVERVEVTVSADLMGMCAIAAPRTGLEGKFSMRHAAAVAVLGIGTGPSGFTDEAVLEPATVAVRERVVLTPSTELAVDGPAVASLVLRDGKRVTAGVNPYRPIPPEQLADRGARLTAKFRELATPVWGADRTDAVVDAAASLGKLETIGDLADLLRT